MGAKHSKNGDSKRADITGVGTEEATAEDREHNNNIVKSLQKLKASIGSPRLSTKLPLKDKRITIEGSRCLLAQASSKAQLDLQQDAGVSVPGLRDIAKFTFPLENAVFEGGGVKGIAYVGAVKVCGYCFR